MARALLVRILCLGLLVCFGCSSGRIDAARRAMEADDLESARDSLEAARSRRPRNVDVRIALGEVYYRIAREALDRGGDEGRYLTYLEKSVDEFVKAVELDPGNEQPHFFLAVMDTYRGDLDAALRGFNITRRLDRSPIAYTNIAEIYVYRGDTRMARRWNRQGLRKGAGLGVVTFNTMLIHWSEGDLRRARRDFEALRERHPELIRTINVARLPHPPKDFEEFAGYCCDSPACGPYLAHACADLGLPVQRRRISNEALLKELRIEIEKQRRLRKVYQQRKELEIEIEAVDPSDPAP